MAMTSSEPLVTTVTAATGFTLMRQEVFLIMSCAMLADANARAFSKDLAQRMPALIVDCEELNGALLPELQLWAPDVICLREVSRYHELEVELRRGGCLGAYKKRTGASRDGCAVFWRGERFQLLEEGGVQLRGYKLRDNVAQVCVLERPGGRGGVGSKDRVVVGDVHVVLNPSRRDVKLGQARVLLESVLSLGTTGRW